MREIRAKDLCRKCDAATFRLGSSRLTRQGKYQPVIVSSLSTMSIAMWARAGRNWLGLTAQTYDSADDISRTHRPGIHPHDLAALA
jgi:hypothetical protein